MARWCSVTGCPSRIATGAHSAARCASARRRRVERQGTHSLGDPAWLLPGWLRHATRHGERMAAGTVVTTGTWVGILTAGEGDLVSVEFPGIGRASVQL